MDKITFHRLVDEGTVAQIDKPEEEPVVHGPGEGRHRVQAVVRVLALVHPLRADLSIMIKTRWRMVMFMIKWWIMI